MNCLTIKLAIALVIAGTVAETQAQVAVVPAGVALRHHTLHNIPAANVHYGRYGYYPGGVYYPKAASARESYLRGMATMTYAQANYNLTMAHVRSIDLENNRRSLENYYDAKQMNRVYKDSVARPRPTADDMARIAADNAPSRLSPSELDANGRIDWPEALQTDEYAPLRNEMDKLFALRAAEGDLAGSEQDRLLNTADAMLAELQSHVRDVRPSDYVSARKFIEGLAYELRQNG